MSILAWLLLHKWLILRLIKGATAVLVTMGGVLLSLNLEGEIQDAAIRLEIAKIIAAGIAISEVSDLIISTLEVRETTKKIRSLKVQIQLAEYIRYVTNDHKARACLLLPDGKAQNLIIYESWGEFRLQERELRFRNSQGLAGYLFWDRPELKVYKVDEDKLTVTELDERWKMTETQIKYTKHIKSMLAVIIPQASERKIRLDRIMRGRLRPIGVIVYDSRMPGSRSKLTSQQAADRALEAAQVMSDLLS